MKDLMFATNINGTDEAGIINVKTMELICLCTEEKSELILKAFKVRDSYVELEEKIAEFYAESGNDESNYEWGPDLCTIGETAAIHFGFL